MLYQTVNNSVNSSAKIKFYLAEPVKVDLAIYNLIGHKLFQLTDKEYLSGMHEIEFNTENLSNGLYIYKMEIADKIVGVKKMKILK